MAITSAEAEAAIVLVRDFGQSFSVEGIIYSRANLSALIDLRDRLRREEGQSAGTRPMMRGFDFTGMGYSA
jgi:hypothetical protein